MEVFKWILLISLIALCLYEVVSLVIKLVHNAKVKKDTSDNIIDERKE